MTKQDDWKDECPVKRVFEAHGVGHLYKKLDDEIPLTITREQKRFVMGLLKKHLNHLNLHLNSIKGKYRERDHIEYQAHLAHTLYQLLRFADTTEVMYRREKGL